MEDDYDIDGDMEDDDLVIVINDNDLTQEEPSKEESPKDELKEDIKEEIQEEPSKEEEAKMATCESDEVSNEAGKTEQTVEIEINNPESVVIAPEELNTDDLPNELAEELNSPEEIYSPTLTYNLAHLLTKESYQDKIELVASSLNETTPSYYVMVKQIPVAVAEFKNATAEVQSIFSDRETFMRSLQLVLANCGNTEFKQKLSDFGVRSITAPVISNKAAVASNVVKATRSLEKAFKKKEEVMFNTFRESFSTATVMYCKNLQKKSSLGKQKSLISKALLIDTLKSVNIANASVLVEEAFKKGIFNDYGVIFEEALSLYTKTPEARKEVIDFVTAANYQADSALDSNQATEATCVASNRVSSVEDVTFDLALVRNAITSRSI
jgi:hypothetical protein